MSERDELARAAYLAKFPRHQEGAAADWDYIQKHTQHPDKRALVEQYRIVDAVLAAGYRRPRTVTTVEELKALRLPAIIDSPAGGPARVEYYAGPGLQQRYVEPLFCDDDSDTECYSPEFFASFGLPATVLHEPEATK